MIYKNTPQLAEWLRNDGLDALAEQSEFILDDAAYANYLRELKQIPAEYRRKESQIEDAAAFRCLTPSQRVSQASKAASSAIDDRPLKQIAQLGEILKQRISEQSEFEKAQGERIVALEESIGSELIERFQETQIAIQGTKDIVLEQQAKTETAINEIWAELNQANVTQAQLFQEFAQQERSRRRWRYVFVGIAVLLALLIFGTRAHAQTVNPAVVTSVCGTPPSNYPSSGRAPETVDTNGNLCAGVSVSATVATAGLAVSVSTGTTSGTAVTPVAGFVTTSAPTYVSGQTNALSLDTSGNLRIVGSISVTQCTSATCTSTIVQPTGTNLHTVVDSGTITSIGSTVNVNFLTANVAENLTQIAGSTIATAASGIMKIGVTDGTGNAITSSGGSPNGLDVHIVPGANTIGTVTAVGAAADGGSAATNPVRIAGKDPNALTQDVLTSPLGALVVDFSATNTVTITGTATVTQATTSSLSASVDLATVRNTATVTAGVAGLLAVGGAGADNAASSGNPVQIGGVDVTGKTQAVLVTTSGTIATDSTIPVLCPTGYTHVQGTSILTSTTTSAIISAVASQFIYVKSVQIVNSGATNALITFYTNASPQVIIGYTVAPTNTTPFGGSNVSYDGTLQTTTANKSLDVGASAGSTSIYVSVQGCQGP